MIVWLLSLSINALLLVMVIIRLLRWLAIFQQKEYRFDRLRVFLNTTEGSLELIRFWPILSEFSLKRLKRPHLTLRALLTFLPALVLATMGWVFFALTNWWWAAGWLLLNLWFVPGVYALAILPSSLLVWIFTTWSLWRASRVVAKHSPVVIGITGSYGKTTTKFLIAQVLKSVGSVYTPPGSHNTALSVSNAIRKNYNGEKYLVVEYAAYTKGEIKRLAKWIKPNLAVITGLSPQHLELFGSVESIISAKSELVKAVANAAPVFVNGFDEGAIKIAQVGGSNNIIPCPTQTSKISKPEIDEDGLLTFKYQERRISTKIIGQQAFSSIALAWEVGKYLAAQELEMIAALEKFKPNTRFITIAKTGKSIIIDDGLSTNPTGFRAGLKLAHELKIKHKSANCVLVTSGIVDMGQASHMAHQDLSQYARTFIDEVWYPGQTGQDEFRAVFANQLFSSPTQIAQRWQELPDNSIVLIEGRLPSWLNKMMGAK